MAVPTLLLLVACSEDEARSVGNVTCLTEAEYQFSGAPEADVLFSEVPYLRADPDRNRVFAIDLRDAQVSAWTPEGTLVFVVGGLGGGPGEFVYPTRIHIDEDGSFQVREGFGSRFTHYTAAGTLAGTVPGTPTSVTYEGFRLNLEAPSGDGGFLGIPSIPLNVGVMGGAPIDRYPVLRVRRSDRGRWLAPEPIFWLDRRNWVLAVKAGDRALLRGQPFSDADLSQFEPDRAVVMRRNHGAGAVELIASGSLTKRIPRSLGGGAVQAAAPAGSG